MKTITFVTSNNVKIIHAREALKGLDFEIVGKKLEIIEPRDEDPEKVVAEKAIQAVRITNQAVITEDSGLFIRALNGFPKTYVHFAIDTLGLSNILKMMDGVEDRYVEFRQSLAYFEPAMSEPKVFSYIDENYFLSDKIWEPEYEYAGELDRILIPPGENKALCCFSPEWRAKRDAKANKDTIHYKQLAVWLSSQLD